LKPAQANSLKHYLRKTLSQKIGLVEWLKVKTLSSRPSTAKKKKRRRNKAMTTEKLSKRKTHF
jgi:hypothetical protein